MFEIRVNGVSRTCRDVMETALDAGRELKHRDLSSEVIIINDVTKEWVVVTDGVFEFPKWRPQVTAADV